MRTHRSFHKSGLGLLLQGPSQAHCGQPPPQALRTALGPTAAAVAHCGAGGSIPRAPQTAPGPILCICVDIGLFNTHALQTNAIVELQARAFKCVVIASSYI